MAITISAQANQVAGNLAVNTDVDETADVLFAVAKVIYAVDIDNTGNGAITYVKIYNNGSPTVGTTAPDWVIPVPASVRRNMWIQEGMALDTALAIAAVTAGGTAGVTGPTSAVTVRMLTD